MPTLIRAITAPATFRQADPATLRALADRYQLCITNPAHPSCPPADYCKRVAGEIEATLAELPAVAA